MPHKVQMIETRHEITNRDVIFSVKKGRKKIGELRVSKGNLVWITGNGRVINQITWTDFNDFMTKGGTWD
jgi:hypothetical protein